MERAPAPGTATGWIHVPLDAMTKVDRGPAQVVIFHCKSGMRTAANADRLSDAANCEAFVLEGGISADTGMSQQSGRLFGRHHTRHHRLQDAGDGR